ncbi:methyltransferase domain-containing protein, partial [Campylobacter jejuni]|nr:methyltransferase domain-containing protein [Campylobacter jejuni]
MENLENDINIKCPLCNAKSKFEKIFYKENVFSGSQIFDFYPEKQKNDIDFGLGDCIMDIRQCCNCGFIYNFEFDHNKIEKVYSSKKYMQQKVFSKTLNNTLVYIKNKIKSFSDKDDIFLEIAPGLGDLLLALSQEVKFIYAVDPSPSSKEIIKNCNNIKYIQSFFDEKIKIKIDKKIDFIIFRHLLEHIENPREFLINVVNMLSEQGKIYIEVPNAQEIFDNGRFYEFFHDHVCYFQPNTLINILNELGCE